MHILKPRVIKILMDAIWCRFRYIAGKNYRSKGLVLKGREKEIVKGEERYCCFVVVVVFVVVILLGA